MVNTLRKKTCPKISPTQIRMGTKHELEHTKSLKLAKKIALDHLCEIPTYYSYLNKMEKQAKKDLHRKS